MARERSHQEEWKTANQLPASEAQEIGIQGSTGPVAYGQPGKFVLPDPTALEDQSTTWSNQPTQPQRRIQASREWPARPSGNHLEWPLRTTTNEAAASPLQRFLDAAHERQFTLGCGTLAALVLIVAAFLAAFSNGWLSTNAGPLVPQPSIQANPVQFTTPIPTITPRPSPTATLVPTDTPIPTVTPAPTATPFPTDTPIPTQTPISVPTASPPPATPTQGPIATPTIPQPAATPQPVTTPTASK